MPTTSHQTKPRRSRWVKPLTLPSTLLLGLCVITLSPSSAIIEPEPLSAQNALDGRRALSALRQAASGGQKANVSVTWEEAQSLSRLAEAARSNERFELSKGSDGDARLKVSKPLPLGLWLNAQVSIRAGDKGKPVISGTVGRLPVPEFLAIPLIDAARWLLAKRGVPLPSLHETVRTVTINDEGLSAQLSLPSNLAVVLALPLQSTNSGVDASLVETHYCRLVTQQMSDPQLNLSSHVNRAFAASQKDDAKDGIDDSRARLVALAMIVGSPELIRLTGKAPNDIKACAVTTADATLLDRRDLALHWANSAALAATLGRESSAIMGLWKEMADSVPGGSGFSYADLAADNAGIWIAHGFEGGRENPKLRAWLAKANEKALLPIEGLDLPEGLATSTPDPAIVARIDERLAARLPR